MRIRTLIATSVMAFPLAAVAEGDSPWLPIPGQFSLGVSYSQQSAKDAYIGDTKLSISDITGGAASKFKRTTTAFSLNYGLSDAVSLDATLGYGKTDAGADDDSGRLDSVIGAKWRVLDEFEEPALPTVTLRAALIVNGNYKGARLAGLGNDANGYELAAIVGKQLTNEFALWGELGFQDRSNDVPNATFVELGARYRFAPQWGASLGYANKRYAGSLDIEGTGFTGKRFQEVREERSVAKLGVGYAIAGNQGVALNLAKVVGDGRNTNIDNQIIGVSYTYAF